MKNYLRSGLLLFFCVLISLCRVLPVFAQVRYSVEKLSLDREELYLEPGERYVFSVTQLPENVPFRQIEWFVSDPSILGVDPKKNEITALASGEAWVYAESFDREAGAVCHVTVGGNVVSKTILSETAGTIQKRIALSQKDLTKVREPGLRSYLGFLFSLPTEMPLTEDAAERDYRLLIHTRPGQERQVAELCRSLGLVNCTALEHSHQVAAQGSVARIADLLRENNDILEIDEDPMTFYPNLEKSEVARKSAVCSPASQREDSLPGLAELRAAGIDGSGAVIAVLDTGLDSSHPDFFGRVAAEHCFSTSGKFGTYRTQSVCAENAAESDSALASGAVFPSTFGHGTHVAGIAGGANGVAPGAKLIAVQIFSEFVSEPLDYGCGDYLGLEDAGACQLACADLNGVFSGDRCKYCEGGQLDPESGLCYMAMSMTSDQFRAYEYLFELSERGLHADVVNLSLGAEFYNEACDAAYPADALYFDRMLSNGMIPVAAAGNEGRSDGISVPSCYTSAMSVGALECGAAPSAASFSNYGSPLDILAPGSLVCSSVSPWSAEQRYRLGSGTSIAAPHVSGALALLKQIFPLNTAQDRKLFYPAVSESFVDSRSENGGRVMPLEPKKPILDLSRMGRFLLDPPELEKAWIDVRKGLVVTLPPSICKAGEKVDGVRFELTDDSGRTLFSRQGSIPCDGTPVTETFNLASLKIQGRLILNVYKFASVNSVAFYSRPLAAVVREAGVGSGGSALGMEPFLLISPEEGSVPERFNFRNGS